MKKLILLIVLFAGILSENIIAQTPEEKAKADTIANVAKLAAAKKKQDSLKELEKKAAAAKAICDSCPQKVCDTCLVKICKPGTLVQPGSWLLVASPIILFLVLLIFLFSNLKGFSINEALSENEYVKKTIINPQYSSAALKDIAGTSASGSVASILPPTIEITDISNNALPPATSALAAAPRASSSRFIALITSTLTLILAVCLCSFFIYFYIATGAAPDISKFSSVLLVLGIGVAPYAFNKIASAITNSKTNTNE